MKEKLLYLYWTIGIAILGWLTASAVNEVAPGAGIKFACVVVTFSILISSPSWLRAWKEARDTGP